MSDSDPPPERDPIDGIEDPDYRCQFCGEPFDGENALQKYASHHNRCPERPTPLTPSDEETLDADDPGVTPTSAPLPYADAFRSALDNLGGSKADADDPNDPFDTWGERASLFVGLLMGSFLAHDPVFRFLVLTLPVLLVAGGGAILRVRNISPRAADAVTRNIQQYYLGVIFEWTLIYIDHNYLEGIKEFLGPLLGAI